MIRTRMLLAFATMTLLLAQAPVQAGLVMSIEDLTGPTGGAGTFEVLLTSTEGEGGQSFDVAAFSFQLTVPTSAGVQFTAGSTATVAAAYLFDGTGTATVYPTFTLANVPPPNTTVTGSDAEWTYSSIAVAPGAVFSLGLMSYSVGPSAPGGDVPISFISSGTSLSDASDVGIDFTTDDRAGVIHVTGSAVPEPSSLVLVASAIGMMLLSRAISRPARGLLAEPQGGASRGQVGFSVFGRRWRIASISSRRMAGLGGERRRLGGGSPGRGDSCSCWRGAYAGQGPAGSATSRFHAPMRRRKPSPGTGRAHGRTVQSGNAVSPLAFAQLALGLRLADPGNGGSKAVVSWAEGTNLLAVWRTCSELSERAISASRRLTETVCEVSAARACTASILTVSSVSCESWSSQTTGSMSVRFLIRLITEHRCAGLGLTCRPPRLISSWFRPRALRTVVAVSRMVESES